MLVRYRGEWQVCYQAKGKLDGSSVLAWVYGPESLFFCLVGHAEELCELPQPNKVPFFDDPFLHVIEEVDGDGRRITRVAGADNIIAANTVWQVLITQRTGNLQMREGSRIIRQRYLWGPIAKAAEN